MSSTTFSMLVRCWYDQQKNATLMQMIRADTSELVRLSDSSFLLFFSVDEETLVVRCFIRHVASGREAYVQGGRNLHAFVKSCLLYSGEPEQNDPGATER